MLRALNRAETQRKRRMQLRRNDAVRDYAAEGRARTRKIREEQEGRNALARKRADRPGGCSRHSFRCSQARNMRVETPACCQRHIRNILRDVGALLDELGITWWADYGTLLGAVRHGGLIPWDKDADLGILADGREKLLSAFPRLMEMDYYPTYVPPRPERRFRTGDRVKVRLSRRNHTNTDVFIWHNRPDGMLERTNYISSDLYKGREFPEHWLHPIHKVPFDDIEVNLPAQAEALVAYRYGQGWKQAERTKHPPAPRGPYEEWVAEGGAP